VRVTVLYFAVVRDLVGLEREDVVLPGGVDRVSAVRAWLEGRHPALAGRLHAVRIAIDEELAPEDERVREGSVIALIPPVAGG
jgi:molybdopterin converting factor subunit 1